MTSSEILEAVPEKQIFWMCRSPIKFTSAPTTVVIPDPNIEAGVVVHLYEGFHKDGLLWTVITDKTPPEPRPSWLPRESKPMPRGFYHCFPTRGEALLWCYAKLREYVGTYPSEKELLCAKATEIIINDPEFIDYVDNNPAAAVEALM